MPIESKAVFRSPIEKEDRNYLVESILYIMDENGESTRLVLKREEQNVAYKET